MLNIYIHICQYPDGPGCVLGVAFSAREVCVGHAVSSTFDPLCLLPLMQVASELVCLHAILAAPPTPTPPSLRQSHHHLSWASVCVLHLCGTLLQLRACNTMPAFVPHATPFAVPIVQCCEWQKAQIADG